MTPIFFKKIISNTFLNIKTILFNIMDNDNNSSFYHKEQYMCFLNEIFELLQNTLTSIENLYYKHVLFPKIQKIYKNETKT